MNIPIYEPNSEVPGSDDFYIYKKLIDEYKMIITWGSWSVWSHGQGVFDYDVLALTEDDKLEYFNIYQDPVNKKASLRTDYEKTHNELIVFYDSLVSLELFHLPEHKDYMNYDCNGNQSIVVDGGDIQLTIYGSYGFRRVSYYEPEFFLEEACNKVHLSKAVNIFRYLFHYE